MTPKHLLWQSLKLAVLIGGVLAVFVSLTTFTEMSHELWLTAHNLLVILSLVLAGLIGYKHRRVGVSFSRLLLAISAYFSVIAVLYLASYTITTAFFAGKMAWIPFFYRDYNYHGFKSVADYLNHKNNFRELLVLQIFSFSIGSVMYFAAGACGYAGAAILAAGNRRVHSAS